MTKQPTNDQLRAMWLYKHEKKPVKEVALIVGVHQSTVYRWFKRWKMQLNIRKNKIFSKKIARYTPEMDIHTKKSF